MVFRFYKFLSLTFYYAQSKLEVENSRTFAGYLWWLLDPLFGVGVYYLLFKVILKQGGDDYIPFLFLGIVCWKWFAGCVGATSHSILNQLGLIKQISIHKSVFPTVDVFYHTWKFLVIFSFIIITFWFLGYPPQICLISLPFILISQFVLIIGIGFLLSSITPFFPDLDFFIQYALQLVFYPSGILFDVTKIGGNLQAFAKFNFIAGLIQSYRNVIMYGKWPIWDALLLSNIVGVLFLIMGYNIIERNNLLYPKMI